MPTLKQNTVKYITIYLNTILHLKTKFYKSVEFLYIFFYLSTISVNDNSFDIVCVTF